MRKHTRKSQPTLWLKITLNTLPQRTITKPTTLRVKNTINTLIYKCIATTKKRAFLMWRNEWPGILPQRGNKRKKKIHGHQISKYVPFRGCTPVYWAEFNQEWLIFNWFNIKKRKCIFFSGESTRNQLKKMYSKNEQPQPIN